MPHLWALLSVFSLVGGDVFYDLLLLIEGIIYYFGIEIAIERNIFTFLRLLFIVIPWPYLIKIVADYKPGFFNVVPIMVAFAVLSKIAFVLFRFGLIICTS